MNYSHKFIYINNVSHKARVLLMVVELVGAGAVPNHTRGSHQVGT